jgi:hypothetical protein
VLLLQAQAANALPPIVTNPGDQVSTEGDSVSLPIIASDPEGQPLSYSASGLPRRIEIDPGTGVICCSINDDQVAGTYTVSVQVSDPTESTTIEFTWMVIPAVLGTGQILRETWTGIPGTEVADLTASPAYPDNPSSSDFLTSFEAPSTWADSYGTRVRGYVHPPITGNYVFWIAADQTAELWLSSHDLPSGATLIASVASPTAPQQWNASPSQESAPIPLVAGERYYIEAIHKEDTGFDHLAVAWQIPGSPLALIDGLYVSELDFTPVFGTIKDQGSYEGDTVSFQVQATDPNEDPLTYSALGLPPLLDIDPSTGLITGTVDMGSIGSYAVTVTAQDPFGEIGSADFTWEVVPEDANLVVPVNKGIACQDSATGIGYLMYSSSDVRQSARFKPNPPISQNAAHFLCIINIGGQWFYDNNDDYFPFKPGYGPWGSDVLVAEVDFDNDTVTDLVGELSTFEGIIRGYESGNLSFTANEYDGVFARGEFSVAGSYFYPAHYATYPVEPVPALPGWGRFALLGLFLAYGQLAVRRRARS